MRKLLLLIFVALSLAENVANAHNYPNVVVIDNSPLECAHSLTIQSIGFPANTQISVSISGVEQLDRCGNIAQVSRTGMVGVLTTDINGNGYLHTSVFGQGSYTLSFYGPTGVLLYQHYFVTQVVYPPGVYVAGMSVHAPFGAEIRMNPLSTSKLIWNLNSSTSMVVLETSIGTNSHLWVRTANTFQLENGVFTEQIGWIDTFNHPLNYIVGTPIVPRVCPQTFTWNQACSLLTTINLKVRANPSVLSPRIGFVVPNTNYLVTARNLSGTWVFVALPSGISGWVCSHLLRINFDLSTLPVADNTQFYCNSDNIP